MSSTPGQVVTFYSYKGGTGRTMALANVAVLFAQEGRGDVLMVDWDLEAPGLHRFFADKIKGVADEDELADRPGLIELFIAANERLQPESSSDAVTGGTLPAEFWRDLDVDAYVMPCTVPSLFLMKAGRFDPGYGERVNTFNWEDLYLRQPGVFRAFAEALSSRYRYILIDSRTGVTDSSGVCTMLLPDRLVVVFTPNRQSLLGVLELVARATTYRRQSDDLRPLLVFPLASRVESSEVDLREQWRKGDGTPALSGEVTSIEDAIRGQWRNPNGTARMPGYEPAFEDAFTRIYELPQCELEHYFNEVQVQHSPRFSYGEEIAVLVEVADRLSLTRSFQRFARALGGTAVPWMFEREPVSVFDEGRDVEKVAWRRLLDALHWHDRMARLYRRRNSAAVAAELGLAVAAVVIALVGGLTGLFSWKVAAIAGIAGIVGALLIRGIRFSTGPGEHAAIHRATANALEREGVFFETRSGAYRTKDAADVLVVRIEEILRHAEEQLVDLETSRSSFLSLRRGGSGAGDGRLPRVPEP